MSSRSQSSQHKKISPIVVACFLAGAAATVGCDAYIDDWLDGHNNPGGSTQPPAGGGGSGGGGGGTPTNPCAAILCPPDTVCEVQEVQCVRAPCPPVASCVKPSVPPPPPTCGPVCDIYCAHGNVLDAKGCPTCQCNPPGEPPPPVDPCATVRCAAGTHCEANAVQCIKAPCPPVASCVPNAPVISCGGIAGRPCPGAGVCVDDPADSCNPKTGGADCGGVCTCSPLPILCGAGTKFDSSPKVCACVPPSPVPPPPPVCGPVCLIYCEFGNVKDDKGCPTCRCNPAPATQALCPPEKCTGPAPKSANYLCTDGRTTAGPACVVTAKGTCDWTVVSCPAA